MHPAIDIATYLHMGSFFGGGGGGNKKQEGKKNPFIPWRPLGKIADHFSGNES